MGTRGMGNRFGAGLAMSASVAALLAGGAVAQEAPDARETAEPPVARMDAVTVTATRTERLMLDVPASVSVVTRDEMERRQARSLDRSEEHTSELQSLMRTSYAGFCL